MSDKKINVKDVTAKEYNPKTHKGNDDRFNPSNRIYVRAVKGYYQRMRRYMGWFFMLVFLLTPWIPYQADKPFYWISVIKSSIFSAPLCGHKISPCWLHC